MSFDSWGKLKSQAAERKDKHGKKSRKEMSDEHFPDELQPVHDLLEEQSELESKFRKDDLKKRFTPEIERSIRQSISTAISEMENKLRDLDQRYAIDIRFVEPIAKDVIKLIKDCRENYPWVEFSREMFYALLALEREYSDEDRPVVEKSGSFLLFLNGLCQETGVYPLTSEEYEISNGVVPRASTYLHSAARSPLTQIVAYAGGIPNENDRQAWLGELALEMDNSKQDKSQVAAEFLLQTVETGKLHELFPVFLTDSIWNDGKNLAFIDNLGRRLNVDWQSYGSQLTRLKEKLESKYGEAFVESLIGSNHYYDDEDSGEKIRNIETKMAIIDAITGDKTELQPQVDQVVELLEESFITFSVMGEEGLRRNDDLSRWLEENKSKFLANQLLLDKFDVQCFRRFCKYGMRVDDSLYQTPDFYEKFSEYKKNMEYFGRLFIGDRPKPSEEAITQIGEILNKKEKDSALSGYRSYTDACFVVRQISDWYGHLSNFDVNGFFVDAVTSNKQKDVRNLSPEWIAELVEDTTQFAVDIGAKFELSEEDKRKMLRSYLRSGIDKNVSVPRSKPESESFYKELAKNMESLAINFGIADWTAELAKVAKSEMSYVAKSHLSYLKIFMDVFNIPKDDAGLGPVFKQWRLSDLGENSTTVEILDVLETIKNDGYELDLDPSEVQIVYHKFLKSFQYFSYEQGIRRLQNIVGIEPIPLDNAVLQAVYSQIMSDSRLEKALALFNHTKTSLELDTLESKIALFRSAREFMSDKLFGNELDNAIGEVKKFVGGSVVFSPSELNSILAKLGKETYSGDLFQSMMLLSEISAEKVDFKVASQSILKIFENRIAGLDKSNNPVKDVGDLIRISNFTGIPFVLSKEQSKILFGRLIDKDKRRWSEITEELERSFEIISPTEGSLMYDVVQRFAFGEMTTSTGIARITKFLVDRGIKFRQEDWVEYFSRYVPNGLFDSSGQVENGGFQNRIGRLKGDLGFIKLEDSWLKESVEYWVKSADLSKNENCKIVLNACRTGLFNFEKANEDFKLSLVGKLIFNDIESYNYLKNNFGLPTDTKAVVRNIEQQLKEYKITDTNISYTIGKFHTIVSVLKDDFPSEFMSRKEGFLSFFEKLNFALASLTDIEKVSDLCKLLDIDKNSVQKKLDSFLLLLDEPLAGSVSLVYLLEIVQKYELNADPGILARRIILDLLKNPVNAFETLSELRTVQARNKDNKVMQDLVRGIMKNPWMSTFVTITSMQGRASKEEFDPWLKEMPKLCNAIMNSEGFNIADPRYGKALGDYVATFGLLHLPALIGICVDLNVKSSGKELNQATIKMLEEIGIDIKGEGGMGNKEIMNSLKLHFMEFREKLLNDELPKDLNSRLGREFFEQLRGSTIHSDGEVATKVVIDRFMDVSKKNRAKFAVPRHAKPGQFEVEMKGRARPALEVEVEANPIKSILFSAQAEEVYVKPLNVLAEACREGMSIENMSGVIKDSLVARALVIASRLGWDNDKLREFMQQKNSKEVDAFVVSNRVDLKDKRVSGIFANLMATIRAIKDFEDIQGYYLKYVDLQVQTAKQAISKMEESRKDTSPDKAEEIDLEIEKQSRIIRFWTEEVVADHNKMGMRQEAGLIELMYKYKNQLPEDLQRKVAANIFVKSKSDIFKEAVLELKKGLEERTPKDINLYKEIVTSHMEDEYFRTHYEHFGILTDETGHLPFLPGTNAWYAGLLGANRVVDKSTGKIPIDTLIERLRMIEMPKESATVPRTVVAMVPVAGIGRVMAPFSGDMCASKLQLQLANGDYPGLYAYLFETKSDGRVPTKILGSVFAMDVKTTDGIPVIAYRANNPREGFVNEINAEQFVMGVARHMVEDTRRKWASQVPRTKVILASPFNSTNASTNSNRPSIRVADKNVFGEPEFLPLEYSETTNFNYNSTYAHARKLFEIDELGNEKWYGKEDFMGINLQQKVNSLEYIPPITLEMLDSNKGREIAGVEVAYLQFRRLNPGLDFTTLNQNPNVMTGLKLSDFAYFVDTRGEVGENMVSLPVVAPHWRSVTQTLVGQYDPVIIINEETGELEPFFEVNIKGCGYTKPAAKGIDHGLYPTWVLDKPTEEMAFGHKVMGCLAAGTFSGQDYVSKSAELRAQGVNCELYWGVIKPKALPFRGKMQTIDWLKENGVLPPEEELEPVIAVRLLKTNTRIEEAKVADDRRVDIFKNTFETFIKIADPNGNTEYKVSDAYLRYFMNNCAKSLASLINHGNMHGGLHSSNITMLAEIMDIDTVNQVVANGEDDPRYVEKFNGVEMGYLKDMRDMAGCLQSLLEAADLNGFDTSEKSKLIDDFMASFRKQLDTTLLDKVGLAKNDVEGWMDWILNEKIIHGRNLESLKHGDVRNWGRGN